MSQDTQAQKDDIPVIDITSTGQQVADALVEAAGRYGFVFIRYEGSGIPASAIKRTFEQVDDAVGGEDWFASRHDPVRGSSGSILRLLHYPALSSTVDYDPAVDIRAGAHSDYGSITLLFQQPSQPGLEILAADSQWVSVPVFPIGTEQDPSPPVLVNIGDLLSYWTNGLLKSTVHRVIFPKDARRGGEDRYSMAYFCHPVNTTDLVPVPSEMVKKRAAGEGSQEGDRAVLTAEEHLNSRLAATYGWSKVEDGPTG